MSLLVGTSSAFVQIYSIIYNEPPHKPDYDVLVKEKLFSDGTKIADLKELTVPQYQQICNGILQSKDYMLSLQVNESPSKKTECSICLDNNVEIVLDKCMHAFCEKCVLGWSARNGSCPICRGEIHQSLKGAWNIADMEQCNTKMKEYMDESINSLLAYPTNQRTLNTYKAKNE